MNRASMAVWIYVRASLFTAAIISLCFIPEAGLGFLIAFPVSLLVAIPLSIPICLMLWFSLKPVYSMNYSFSTCLVFFGFANTLTGVLVIHTTWMCMTGSRANHEVIFAAGGLCVVMACGGCYFSRNMLKKYYRECQLPASDSEKIHEQELA